MKKIYTKVWHFRKGIIGEFKNKETGATTFEYLHIPKTSTYLRSDVVSENNLVEAERRVNHLLEDKYGEDYLNVRPCSPQPFLDVHKINSGLSKANFTGLEHLFN